MRVGYSYAGASHTHCFKQAVSHMSIYKMQHVCWFVAKLELDLVILQDKHA